MERREIETKLFMEWNIKTERKELKGLRKDLEKYTRTRKLRRTPKASRIAEYDSIPLLGPSPRGLRKE